MTLRKAKPIKVSTRRPAAALARAGALGLGLAAAAAFPGCEADSWLFNPSVVGRWEATPTIVPVLERVDVIEADTGDYVEITQPTRDDLTPQANPVRAKPGDPLKITVLDFPEAGKPGEFQRIVDTVGCIDLPLVPRIKVSGLSGPKIQAAIEKALVEAQQLDRPVVQVEFGTQEDATFRVFGYVEKSGQYRVPGPEYRLLQGLTDAGGVSPVAKKIYVIRQISLAEELDREPSVPGDATAEPQPGVPKSSSTGDKPGADGKPAPSGEDLLKVIDDLTAEPKPAPAPAPTPEKKPEPAPQGGGGTETPKVSSAQDSPEHEALMSALSGNDDSAPRHFRPAAPRVALSSLSAAQDGSQPAIDLPEGDHPVAKPAEQPEGAPSSAGGQWVFLNGEWVQVFRKSHKGGGLPEGQDPLKGRSSGVEDLLTQRVIEVPVAPLLQGAAQYNIVLRAGDVVHVPGPEQGFVYAEGPGISRAGVYSLPGAGQLTLLRLVGAAGGLSEIAIPERVDLTRRVGDKRQATIRLNLRAIYEGTQPDIVLKADDLVNFGTNFWATPLAIIRSGFRITYGFGFLADRNWGSDIFGVPPESRARGFGN